MNIANKWLCTQDAIYGELYTEMMNALWRANTTNEMEWYEAMEQAEAKLRRHLGDLKQNVQCEQLARGELSQAEARMLEVLQQQMLEHRMSEEQSERLSRLFSEVLMAMSPEQVNLGWQEVPYHRIREILFDSLDCALRQQAWLSSKQVGEVVAPMILEMVHIRNEIARAQGFADYYEMAYQIQGLSMEETFGLFDEVERVTEAPFQKMKQELDQELALKFDIRVEDLRPHHYADPFFQEAPIPEGLDVRAWYASKPLVEAARQLCERLGFDVSAILERSDLYPRAGKGQTAYCIHPSRCSDDVRIFSNLTQDLHSAEKLLHELGHAVYFQHLDPELPYLLRQPVHTFVTEGVAILFGEMNEERSWLLHDLGLRVEEVTAQQVAFRKLKVRNRLINTRWNLTVVRFERELYSNPHQDLNRLWWELANRLQGLQPPERLEGAHWATKSHLALLPVYYQNYLLGEIFADQLHAYLKNQVATELIDLRVGAFLRDKLFVQGARQHWKPFVKDVLGAQLGLENYLFRIKGGHHDAIIV